MTLSKQLRNFRLSFLSYMMNLKHPSRIHFSCLYNWLPSFHLHNSLHLFGQVVGCAAQNLPGGQGLALWDTHTILRFQLLGSCL